MSKSAHSFSEAANLFGFSASSPVQEKWIDSHCHYESGKFNKNRDEIISKVQKCCKNVICVGTNIKENAAIEKLKEKYDFMYAMYGFFPTSVCWLEPELCKDAENNWNKLIRQLKTSKCVGLGEIGLDYSWNSCGDIKGDKAREYQKKWFIKQIDLAREMDLPISIHSRDAEDDTNKILDGYDSLKGVVHCFSYSPDTALFFVSQGLYLGIGGTSTYKANSGVREAIKQVPLNKILLETDAPYLSPEPVRRSINDSSNIKYIIQNIADIKEISEDEVIYQTNKNCHDLYGI